MTVVSDFRPDDVYRIVAARHVRLHPSGHLGAILSMTTAGETGYASQLIWLRQYGAEWRVAPDPEANVVDIGWSPAGDHHHKIVKQTDGLKLIIGTWNEHDTNGAGGTAFHLNGEPDRVCWSRDGRRLVFTTKVRPPGQPEDTRHLWLRGIHPFKREPQGFVDGTFRQVFLAEWTEGKSWTFRQLTTEAIDHTMPSLSPDGQIVTYVRPVPGVDGYYGQDRVVAVDLATAAERVLIEIGGPCLYPTWDPEGRYVAWLGHDGRMGSTEGTDLRLLVLDTRTGAHKEISNGFGLSIEDVIVDDTSYTQGGARPIAWTEGDRGLLAIASDGGVTSVWRFDASIAPGAPGRVTPVVAGQRRIVSFDEAAGRRLVAYADPDDPSRVAVVSDAGETVVYAPNREWLAERRFTRPTAFEYHGAQGDRIEGWIVAPHRRPLAGAPSIVQLNRGRWGWSFYLESQILAAAGFAVAYVNPHGSYGYGEVFRASTHYDPATLEVDDVVLAVDEIIKMGVDRHRVGINGTSFGGFLTNWLLTQHPERFAAAVAQASYCNRHNLWGTSSIGPSRWDRPGAPWEHAEFLLARSPLSYVDRVRIPMLLIHGEKDTICPLEQAEQWYTALAMRGLDPTWLILKGEAHDLARTARPESRVLRMSAIVAWFQERLLEVRSPTGSAG